MAIISGSQGLGFGAAFTLRDRFSSTSERINRNMQRMSAQTDATARKVEAGAMRMRKGFKQMMIGGGALAALSLPVAAAANFEEAMVEVEKVTDPETAKVMSEEVKGLAKSIPMATSELAGLAADSARFGIEGPKNIKEFTETTAKMATATDLNADQAGESLAKLATVTDTSTEKVENMGSSINELSNTAATSSSEIVDNMLRASKGMVSLGTTQTELAAVSTTLNEVSANAARAGTQMNRLASLMLQPDQAEKMADAMGMSVDKFTEMRDEDPTGMLVKMAKAFRDNKEAEEAFRSNISSAAIKALSGLSQNVEGLEKNLSTSAEAFEKNVSLQKEFEAAIDTLKARLTLLWNEIKITAMNIGDALLPSVKLLVGVFLGLVGAVNMIVNNPVGKFFVGLAAFIASVTLVVGAFNAAVGWANAKLWVLAGRFGLASRKATLYKAATLLATKVTNTFTLATRRLGVALRFLTGPVGWIIAAVGIVIGLFKGMIAALKSANPLINAFGYALAFAFGPIGWIVAGVTTLNRAINEFHDILSGESDVQKGFVGFLQKIGGIIQGLKQIWASWNGQFFEMSNKMANTLKEMGLLDFVLNLGTHIIRLKAFLTGIAKGLEIAFVLVKNAFKDLLVAFTPGIDAFEDFFGAVNKNQTALLEFREAGISMGQKVGHFIAKMVESFKVIAPVIRFLARTVFDFFRALMDGAEGSKDIGDVIMEKWKLLKNKFKSLGVEIGEKLVEGMKNGFKSTIEAFREEVKNSLEFQWPWDRAEGVDDAIKQMADDATKGGSEGEGSSGRGPRLNGIPLNRDLSETEMNRQIMQSLRATQGDTSGTEGNERPLPGPVGDGTEGERRKKVIFQIGDRELYGVMKEEEEEDNAGQ